jgi:hypothetical protein
MYVVQPNMTSRSSLTTLNLPTNIITDCLKPVPAFAEHTDPSKKPTNTREHSFPSIIFVALACAFRTALAWNGAHTRSAGSCAWTGPRTLYLRESVRGNMRCGRHADHVVDLCRMSCAWVPSI